MGRVLIGLAAVAGASALAACHPTAQDSPGANPVPPADAPSDSGVSGAAPADVSGAASAGAD